MSPVQHRNSAELHAEYAFAIAQRLDMHAGPIWISRLRRKRVVVNAAQRLFGLGRCVERNLSAFAKDRKAQRPQIVQPEDVVGMAVGIENCVNAGELVAQCLFAKIRPGIDQHHTIAVPSCHRNSTEGRSRRSRGSGDVHTGAVTPQRGNPHRSPGPQKCQLAFHYR